MPSLLTGLEAYRPSRLDSAPVISDRLAISGKRIDSTYNPITALGGSADKGSVARPTQGIPLSDSELKLLYSDNGISHRIVTLLPSRACRRGWVVPGIGHEDKVLKTWGRVREALCMAGLTGGSLVMMVTSDVGPGRGVSSLSEPLDLSRIGKLSALHVFDSMEAWPHRWNTDITSPYFRSVSEWAISTVNFRAIVHASRVLHFSGLRKPTSDMQGASWSGSRMPGVSRLQPVWNEIRRLTEVQQGGAVLAQELRESVLKLGNLATQATGDEASETRERLSLMAMGRSMLNMVLLGPNDDYTSRSNPPTGYKELSDACWSALAAVTGIPEVILRGATPGGLSTDGSSSWEGFRQLVSDYQETEMREQLEQLYTVVYAAKEGPTKGRAPEDWSVDFLPLDEPSEEGRAKVRGMIAATDALYIDRGVYSPEDVARSRFGEDGWQVDMLPVGIPDESVEDAMERARQLMDEPEEQPKPILGQDPLSEEPRFVRADPA